MLVTHIAMAEEVNKIKKWIKKWKKDKVDIGAGEEKPHTTDTAENLREAADKVDIGAGEEKPHTTETRRKTFEKQRIK